MCELSRRLPGVSLAACIDLQDREEAGFWVRMIANAPRCGNAT